MREWRRTILLTSCMVMLAACGGGSGSTGLITSEGSVIDQVRQDGDCEELDGVPYCATDSPDATAPGGQSVSVDGSGAPTPAGTATPLPTPTPGGGGAPTSTPVAAGTPTPIGASATAAPPTPSGGGGDATATRVATTTPIPTTTPVSTASPAPQRSVTADVDGFEDGAACATAARAADSADVWLTAALVPLDPDGVPIAFPIAGGLPSAIDTALLCFDDPPSALPPQLVTLADAAPTVVFVLP